jgi:hypothetical protein
MGNVIVCGFYTEDYRRWLIPLVVSLGRRMTSCWPRRLATCGKPTPWPA